ncbi:hypothetical protein QJS10_CPA08g00567 [Acorus calamus]|uniref:HTH OST-type domain-containing protein n=1 Tax=Acorus calamus TaxID=4465 RepID=A0AAV9E994_ACOCL|nr:hypothetical protein QJS10_CPA08g00567 [Acorus calamus]
MKTLTLRTLIINSRHRRLPLQPLHTVLLFHSRAAVEETLRRISSSSSSSSPPPSSPSKQKHYHHHDEESKAVKVLVWWDFENCSIPGDVNPSLVGPRIMSALRSNGVRGPVSITAVGDVLRLARQTQEAVSATGVSISHIPSGGQISADRTLLIDLLYWVSQNPPPAHLFLISGDKGFAGVLHRLRMNNYNILLASNEGTSNVLFSTASIMWPWTSLVKGESLIGKHFNNPPDGIYGSWYGHYKGPLDDPFSETEHLTCTTSESLETAMDSKPHPIPRVIVNKIRDILYWYPDGASFSELWLELKRSNIVIDKDFFGHKHFSCFLLSMPNILQIRRNPSGDGEPLVYGTHKKLSSYVEANLKPPPGVGFANGDMDPRMAMEQNGKSMPAASRLAFGKHSLAHEKAPLNVKSAQVAQQPLVEGHTPIFNETTTDEKAHLKVKPMQVAQHPVVEEHTLISKEDAVGETVVGHLTRGKEYDPRTEGGLLKKLWRKWFDNKTTDTVHWMDSSNGNKLTSVGNDRTCAGSTKSVADEKAVKLNDIQDQSNSCLVSEGTKPVFDHDIRGGTVKPEDESRKGLFNRIVKWCRFWRNDTESGEHKSQSFRQVVNDEVKMKPETHDLFSKDHFWDSMESFLHTAKGLSLISRSESSGMAIPLRKGTVGN